MFCITIFIFFLKQSLKKKSENKLKKNMFSKNYIYQNMVWSNPMFRLTQVSFLFILQFGVGLNQGLNNPGLIQSQYNDFVIFIVYIILYNNIHFLFRLLREKKCQIILYHIFFYFLKRNAIYLFLLLFWTLSYLLFKFSYKYREKCFLKKHYGWIM